MGFTTLVAPVNKIGSARDENARNSPQARHVQQLLGGTNAKTKMAPSLLHCIRGILESKKMSSENISAYLSKLGSLQRYDSAFRKVYVLLREQGMTSEDCSAEQIAGAIITLYDWSPSDARNASSACCLLPHVALRFCTLLNPFKRLWNVSCQKYATFWDPENVLRFFLNSKNFDSASV